MPNTPSLTRNMSRRVCSAPACPPSRVLSDRGLCSCPPCPSSLKMQVGGSVLPPPALCLTFRATKGSVHAQHAHHPLPHSRHELAGPFCLVLESPVQSGYLPFLAL